ncbi:MAG: fibronectin type III domain-containing protein, partial [Candidatus Zixiibacteriota bacterium]
YNMYRSFDPDSHYVKINEAILPRNAGYYEDRAVALVDKYYYRVSALDLAGNESHLSARAVSIFKNTYPPIPPQEVTAESRPDAIYIQWAANPEEDVRGYYVYRADRLNGELAQVSPLLPGDTTWYLDTDPYLSPLGRYFYYVQAINYSDLASGYSEMVIASPKTIEGPEPPLSFYGYQDINFIRLLWTPKDDNIVAGYHVYRAVMQDSLQWERLSPRPLDRNIGMFIDNSAEIGPKYIYHVRSINDAGLEGNPSHYIDVTRFEVPLKPPWNVRVNRTPDGLRVRWDPNFQKGLSGYRVYRRTGLAEAAAITPLDIAGDKTEYTDKQVQPDTRYYYSVSSVDELGREGARSPEVEMYYEK